MAEAITREEAEERKARRGSAFAKAHPDQHQAIQEYWTPERRQEKREQAQRLHAEGKFGGRQAGAGRPRVKGVSEVISEEAQKEAKKIYAELKKMIFLHPAADIKLGAIDRVLKAEHEVQKNMREDEREIARLGGKELQTMLLGELLSIGGEDIMADIPEDDIEEITDDID